MSLRVAIQMDPIEGVNIDGDTSFALALEAQARGHSVFVYGPGDLVWDRGAVRARGRRVTLRRERGNHVSFAVAETLDLRADLDIVLMRQDPPFDMAYLTAAHVLEQLAPDTLVLNDPFWVRSSPEKILPLDFPDLGPATLVSRDAAEIRAFRKEMGDVIVKPLYGNGGAGVFALKNADPNLAALLELFFERSREPVIVQQYLPDVTKGDKRVILIDGEAAGAINRVPQPGEARSNMHVGGKAEKAELTPDDRRICETIGPVLRARGLVLVGIDVIGGKLTEINVTSPTGVQELQRFSGIDCAALFWDAAERRWADKDFPIRGPSARGA
jgi:glutathione synthase